jgi:prevent-host-death family protein
MRLSESVTSISHLKAHAAELIREVAENQRMLVITQKGEAKAIIQDLASYERMNDSLALLKMLAQSARSKASGRHKPVAQAFRDLRLRVKDLP